MSTTDSLSATGFAAFFRALWGYDPFPWQSEFAARLCTGNSPDYVTVPTGSGKTACLDAAVFALAVQVSHPPGQRTTGRRIFFIVNRRIIVDEAFERAQKYLAPALADPSAYLDAREAQKEPDKRLGDIEKAKAISVLCAVRDALRRLGGTEEPLLCAQLRGVIFRDRAWAKSLIQPTIICSTVDQAGSRLLFRGYGVSPEARPIHAALVGQDSVILIDEAHISQPFLQTLEWVRHYRLHSPPKSETVALPFTVLRMTATPPKNVTKEAQLGLSAEDQAHPVLKARLAAKKPAILIPAAAAKGKIWIDKLADELEVQASKIISEHSPNSLAVMVNRVATARVTAERLKKKHPRAVVHLLLGRMRPLDRDQVTGDLQKILKTGQQQPVGTAQQPLQIIVSTQCLEVGADLDFDALVTECASIDALRQRFGRLNRGGRHITAHATIVFPEEYAKADSADPIYGTAIKHTWDWLCSQQNGDNCVDFGLQEMTAAVAAARDANEEAFANLLSPRSDAPVLLPAYIDCWTQTNPGPAADPDVSLFLHGPQRDMADVQVCWRSDLPEEESLWADTVALCPPTTLECLPVPLHVASRFLNEGKVAFDLSGDVPSCPPEEASDSKTSIIKGKALLWRGDTRGENKSVILKNSRALKPGDTLVLRTQDGGWEDLGHIPNAASSNIDRAEFGITIVRRRAIVRIHPLLWPRGGESAKTLLDWALPKKEDPASEREWKSDEVREMLVAAAEELRAEYPELSMRLFHLSRTSQRYLDAEMYPASDDKPFGVVLSVREPFISREFHEVQLTDDGPDDPLLETRIPQSLTSHTAQVIDLVSAYAKALDLDHFSMAFVMAAKLHDIGKADRRFQAMLNASDITTAMMLPKLLAKSSGNLTSPAARQRNRERANLPDGFRHEMLSVLLACTSEASQLLPDNPLRKALTLHLIGSHHGQARPFALAVEDEAPPDVTVEVEDIKLSITSEQRSQNPAHAIDSGIAERFWQLTRHHGWWGLALLETILRMADQTASANPDFAAE